MRLPKRRPFRFAEARLSRHVVDGTPRGQSLVEFALVLPMLLVLLLGIADFGRVMSSGIVLEAAVRDGAEAAAQELVQLQRNKPSGLDSGDYAYLHDVALKAMCDEAEVLPNAVASGGLCTMPYAAVCIHDATGGDGTCGDEAAGVPSQCSALQGGWAPTIQQTYPAQPLPYVEVRACYRFTTLVNLSDLRLPFGWSLSLGDVWLQRDRSFVAGNY